MRWFNYIAKCQLLTRRPSLFCIKLITICVLLLVVYVLYPRRQRYIIEASSGGRPVPNFIVRSARNNNESGTADGSDHGGQRMHSIPKIIHQTWKSKEGIPETFRPWMESWIRKNSNWDYWFWTDEDMRNLVSTTFPEFLSLYDSYPSQFYRADAFRYFLLYSVGGVYVDLDMECLRPFDEIALKDECVISQEPLEHAHFLSSLQPPLVSNALMACRPNHPFFEYVINNLKSYVGYLTWNDILRATGPLMLTDVFRNYHDPSVFGYREGADPIRLASPEEFQPYADDSMIDHMRKMCTSGHEGLFPSESFSRRQKALCKKVLGHDFGRRVNTLSFSDHHWTHTWAGKYHDPWGVSDMRIRFSVTDMLSVHRQ